MLGKMTHTYKSILFLHLLSFLLLSCSSPKNVAGTYHSSFPELGMFGTTIRLKSDSTLEYVFQGDLMYDSATGGYKIIGNKIYVLFDKELTDSNNLNHYFDNMPLKTATNSGGTISYKLILYSGDNKLFQAYAETGKKITRAKQYHKRKKYLLFGSHYYGKRFYYKRIT
jgi:hypothetical protein